MSSSYQLWYVNCICFKNVFIFLCVIPNGNKTDCICPFTAAICGLWRVCNNFIASIWPKNLAKIEFHIYCLDLLAFDIQSTAKEFTTELELAEQQQKQYKTKTANSHMSVINVEFVGFWTDEVAHTQQLHKAHRNPWKDVQYEDNAITFKLDHDYLSVQNV